MRPDSQNADLAGFQVGEVRWVERTGIRPPIPPTSRRPPATANWLFEAVAFLAVPQTTNLNAEPVRLWRVRRIA